MTNTADTRFIVRIGDDGAAKSRHATLAEARKAAHALSTTGWALQAQIIDTADGWRESWRDGKVR